MIMAPLLFEKYVIASKLAFKLCNTISLQAMTNDFDLNMENNMRMRDTQFFCMFCLKTLENQIKC